MTSRLIFTSLFGMLPSLYFAHVAATVSRLNVAVAAEQRMSWYTGSVKSLRVDPLLGSGACHLDVSGNKWNEYLIMPYNEANMYTWY